MPCKYKNMSVYESRTRITLLLNQWFSTFLKLWAYNSVPYAVMTPIIKLFLLLFHDCNFTTGMNYDVNIWYLDGFRQPLWKGFNPQRTDLTHRLRTTALNEGTDLKVNNSRHVDMATVLTFMAFYVSRHIRQILQGEGAYRLPLLGLIQYLPTQLAPDATCSYREDRKL